MSMALIILIICLVFMIFIIHQSFKYPAKSKSARRIRGFIVIALLIVLAVSALLEFGPRGNNSLFSKPGAGMNKGSDFYQLFSNKSVDDLKKIIIEGNTVTIGNKKYKGVDKVEEFLESNYGDFDFTGVEVTIIDNYASSNMYHFVYDWISDKEAEITEERQK